MGAVFGEEGVKLKTIAWKGACVLAGLGMMIGGGHASATSVALTASCVALPVHFGVGALVKHSVIDLVIEFFTMTFGADPTATHAGGEGHGGGEGHSGGEGQEGGEGQSGGQSSGGQSSNDEPNFCR
jgi:hypothetical protein